LIIRLIIQTILLHPSGAVWTDEASNVSSLVPSGAVQSDAEHPARNRKVARRPSCLAGGRSASSDGRMTSVPLMEVGSWWLAIHVQGLPAGYLAAGGSRVQSPVGALDQGLLEGLAGGEPEDEWGLGSELAFDVDR
jgi:hypothetical protein